MPSNQKLRLLVAEDDPAISNVLKRVLENCGYSLKMTTNGRMALAAARNEKFDGIVTDWMMPEMDGIEFVRRVRETCHPSPVILFITALDSPKARVHALKSGADEYLAKPFLIDDLKNSLQRCFKRLKQPLPTMPERQVLSSSSSKPPYIAVCIAASTGGPPVLNEIVPKLPASMSAAYFLTQHGPGWMLGSLATHLDQKSKIAVKLVKDGSVPEPGALYIAPGDRHLVFDQGFCLRLQDSAPENHVRPAANPMFRSAAKYFGKQMIGVVLTGLGRDGCSGAASIHQAGGTLIVQDPNTCVAPYMPSGVLEMGIPCESLPPHELAAGITQAVNRQISLITRR